LFVVLRSPSSHAVALGFKLRPTFIQEVGVTDYNADAKEKISSLRSSFSFARREGGREEDDSAKKETQTLREYSETLIVVASWRARGCVEKCGEV
jgi:hypothetical protein